MSPTSLVPVLPFADLPFAVGLLVKVTLVLAAGAALAALMRHRAAAVRQEVWALALLATLALAPLAALAPSIPVPVLATGGPATPAPADGPPRHAEPAPSASHEGGSGVALPQPAGRGDAPRAGSATVLRVPATS